MSNLPRCPNAEGRGGRPCPSPAVRLHKETETDWVFICETCKSMRVMTKPAGWRRAAMENEFRSGLKQRSSYDRKIIYSR
jgi:hypothetical protein